MAHSSNYFADVLIIGGGIVGLWTLNRLKQQGYNATLLESNALGCGQTGHSQGIIHGGIKYTLKGQLTSSATSIADMPQLWKDCIQGKGEIDLTGTQLLSEHYYLWSNNKLSGKVGNFLLKKILRSHSESISPKEFPEIFNHPQFKGQVLRVSELVIDIPSLIHCLRKNTLGSLYKVASKNGIEVSHDGQAIDHLVVRSDCGKQQRLSAKHYIFCAGESNEMLLSGLAQAPVMQTRPLHMAMVKPPCNTPVYAHCLGKSSTPRITITSHKNSNDGLVWYIGGNAAETGTSRTPEEQQQFIFNELEQLFPWLQFSLSDIQSFYINRAEIQQPDRKRPNSYFYDQQHNWHVAWPTKLALTPLLTRDIVDTISQNTTPMEMTEAVLADWPHPETFCGPWETIC